MELTKPTKPPPPPEDELPLSSEAAHRSEDEVSDEKDLPEIKYIGGGMLSE